MNESCYPPAAHISWCHHAVFLVQIYSSLLRQQLQELAADLSDFRRYNKLTVSLCWVLGVVVLVVVLGLVVVGGVKRLHLSDQGSGPPVS